MGSRTAAAARDVALQRERVAAMVDDLDRRTRDDIQGAADRVGERVDGVKQRFTGAVADMKEQVTGGAESAVDHVPGAGALGAQLDAHPLSGLLAAFGAGIALGVASEGGGDGRRVSRQQVRKAAPTRSRREEPDEDEDEGGVASALMGALTGQAVGMVAGPLRSQVQSLLEERFKLVIRRESRETSHFSLLLARDNRRLGPGLVQRDCRNPDTRPKRASWRTPR